MQLVSQNPYHILGLVAGANQRTIEKQKGKINAYQKVGKDIEFDEDLIAFGKPERSNGSTENAFSNIEINQSKLFYSLFWFVKTSHLDETALNYLKSDDLLKAEDIWTKIVTGKAVSDKNMGAYNNLGTLKFFKSTLNGNLDTAQLLEAVKLKTELITSVFFDQFCHSVTDETYTANINQELHRFVNAILEEAKSKGHSEAKRLPGMISKAHPSLKTIVSDKVADEPFHNIDFILEQTKKKRTANPASGFALARKLYTATKDDFGTLADILGKSDPKYKLIADKLAKEILQCGIDYFKEFREDEDQHKGDLGNDIMKLFKYANFIATGIQTKDRIEQNIEGLQEWIDSADIRELQNKVRGELQFITARLEHFQTAEDSIENAENLVDLCAPKLSNMKEALSPNNELYLSVSSTVVNNAQGMLVTVVNNAQKDPLAQAGIYSKLETVISDALRVSKKLSTLAMVSELKNQYQKNQETLNSINNQLKIANLNIQRTTVYSSSSSTKSSSTTGSANSSTEYGCLFAGLIATIIIIALTVVGSKDNSSSNRPFDRSTKPSNSSTTPSTSAGPISESKFKGNQLNNGDSPYDKYFGKGVYNKSHNNWVQFKNGNSQDVVVCLVDVYSGRTIRNEYIRAGSTFKMTNIPNSTYYIKGFYGKDWNPQKKIDNTEIKGGFETDFNFSKSDGYNDRLQLQDNGYQYSTYEVTLYSVYNGNMSQEAISQSEFFK